MSTHNTYFHGDMRKISVQNYVDTPSDLELCLTFPKKCMDKYVQ